MKSTLFLLVRGLWFFLFFRFNRLVRSEKALKSWQQKKILSFQQGTLRKSPYFRSLAGKPLTTWPLMDKSVMMEHFTRINTAGIGLEEALSHALRSEQDREFSENLRDCTVGLSSGTSGSRGLFLASREDRVLWAAAILARVLPKPLLRRRKIALFLRANSTLYETINSLLFTFRFFDLMESPEVLSRMLQEFNPAIIVAPPSLLRFLAAEQTGKKLLLKPEKILSCAEVLDPLDQKFIAKAFDQKVHQIYQCTEGFLGATCELGVVHLNEDMIFVEKEFLDEKKRKFVPVITDFSRRAQPIVRYRLNDILTLKKEPCACGRITTPLEFIEGRCDDMFLFSPLEGAGPVSVFPDFIRRAVIMASPLVVSYLVVQMSPAFIQVSLQLAKEAEETRKEVEEAVRKSLYRLLERYPCVLPDIGFREVDFKPGMKKLKRIERAF